MRHISLITTGGTMEKTYDERTGSLENRHSIVRTMLSQLRLEDVEISAVELMSKDSKLMDEVDRGRIVEMVRTMGGSPEIITHTTGLVILHGTDTLETTGEALHVAYPVPRVPIILTGAIRPYEMSRTDALQNLTEAIFAAGVLEPGVYCVAHGNAHRFPGVVKDRVRQTFVKMDDGDTAHK